MTTFSDDELQIDEESVEDLQPTDVQTDSVEGGRIITPGVPTGCPTSMDHESLA
jgi:hypothetical protein